MEATLEMSLEAMESLKPYLSDIEQSVIDCIMSRGGATCDEVEQELEMRHQTISSRITFLHQAGTLEDSGERRLTRSGRRAIVWQLASMPVTAALREKRGPIEVESDTHVPALA